MDPINSQLFRMGGSSTSYWIATLGGPIVGQTGDDFGRGIAVDSSGNVFVVGYTNSQGLGNSELLLAKYDTSGTIQWQRSLGSSSNEYGYGIAVDSSGNVYVVGSTDVVTIGWPRVLLAKYNTSGTIQWQRSLGDSSYKSEGYNIAVDISGNVYVCGRLLPTGSTPYYGLLAKYNTIGTIQWQRSFTPGSIFNGIDVDSSGNVYIVGGIGSSYDNVILAKYNTSGTIQWQRSLSGTGVDYGYDIAVDSSGNVYFTGYTNSAGGSGSYDLLVAKYDTSGTIQWQRSLGSSSNEYGYGIAVDSSGNVYVTGRSDTSGNKLILAKYDTSGTIQWQRGLDGTGWETGYDIDVDSSGNVFVVGYTNSQGAGSYDFLIAKVPDNGSKTGTYGNLTYAVTTLTDASRALTDAVGTLTQSTDVLSTSTPTLTDAARTLTSTTTQI